MQSFFDTTLSVLEALGTAFGSFKIVSCLDGSELGTARETPYNNDSIICVLEDRHGTKLRWIDEYNGTPIFGNMHRNGFFIYSAKSRPQGLQKLLLNEVTERSIVHFREKIESDEARQISNNHQQWNTVSVTNVVDTFLIKNVQSGKCLRNVGSGRAVSTGSESIKDRAQWWKITKSLV